MASLQTQINFRPNAGVRGSHDLLSLKDILRVRKRSNCPKFGNSKQLGNTRYDVKSQEFRSEIPRGQ
jgi:hypothetical protein